jgi:hypothetical protein
VLTKLCVYTLKSADSLSDAIQSFLTVIGECSNRAPHLHMYYTKLILQFLTFLPEEALKIKDSVRTTLFYPKIVIL